MYYKNQMGSDADSSALTIPVVRQQESTTFKVEFYYFMMSSGYQALQLYKRTDDDEDYQIWHSEATPPELEEIWIYACSDIPENIEGNSRLYIPGMKREIYFPLCRYIGSVLYPNMDILDECADCQTTVSVCSSACMRVTPSLSHLIYSILSHNRGRSSGHHI